MKKKFLLVSMIAAVMFTASCSKEDNGDNSEQPVNVEQQIVQNTRPIVIKVDKKTSLSKVGTSNGYDLTFSATDKLVLTDGTNNYAELDLQAGDEGKSTATFTGEISTDADGKEIYATVGSPLEGVQTSSTSLADVVANNCYLKSATFTYSKESELDVELSDQNAYLVFSVSEGQKKVNIGDSWYPTDGDIVNQKLYVAVSAGEVSGRFFGTKTLEASKIYTITREDVVDLGQTVDGRKIVWKAANEIENSSLVFQGLAYYDWAAAEVFASQDANGYRLPTKTEMESLYALAQGGYVNKDNVSYKAFSNEYGSVFLQPAGYKDSDDDPVLGVSGAYWTNTVYNSERIWRLKFNTGTNNIGVNDGDLKSCHLSVRLVRGL